MSTKINCCLDRLYAAGLMHPSEKTQQAVVAMLAGVHCPTADAKTLWGIVQTVKLYSNAHRYLRGKTLQNFPPDGHSLPEELWQRAYCDGPPVPQDVPAAQALMQRIPMRANNKLLGTQGAAASGAAAWHWPPRRGARVSRPARCTMARWWFWGLPGLPGLPPCPPLPPASRPRLERVPRHEL